MACSGRKARKFRLCMSVYAFDIHLSRSGKYLSFLFSKIKEKLYIDIHTLHLYKKLG